MGMRLLRWIWCIPVLFPSPLYGQQLPPRPLIVRPIDESQLTSVKGSTHPLARPQFDLGIAPPDLPMNRMLLVMRRSPQQDLAIHRLLDDQQDKASAMYHRWLTPDEFGQQFGPSDQDIQQVTAWLQSHGLQVNHVSRGRSVIEFSGTESQVEEALHTQIHQYSVNGENHWANATDPQIPAALAPAVAGVRALNDFPPRHFSTVLGVMARTRSDGQIVPVQPTYTFGSNCGVQSRCYGIGPYDFAKIYNVISAWNAATPVDGTGQTIAIVGETDINPQDVADFRQFFGLPAYGQPGGPALNIIHNGPAPGIFKTGEQTESDLDVQWSGAIAKGANIDFVVSQSTQTTSGIDLSALYIVDNNLAPVMSESYGFCELYLGTAGNQFFSSLWQQAAAQGITVMISSGDGSSAGCDNFNIPQPASLGLQVNGYSSTPYNVAVGGTDFNDLRNASTYWSATNAVTTQASALGYIPETTWDDNCTNPVFATLGFSSNAETNCNNSTLIGRGFLNVLGGSGGRSNCISSDGLNLSSCLGGYPKPSWQNAPGVPTDGVRDVPDVSLFAAVGSPSGSFYIVCRADVVGASSCDPNNPSTRFLGIGGTSASAPAFAGIMALVNQQEQIIQQAPARQGNANFVLYKLAQQHPAVFHDVTTGTIAPPCVTGSPNCTTSKSGDQYGILSGYNAGANYDLATGIGSVDVGALVQNWSLATFQPSLTSLALNPKSGLTHGQSVAVTGTVAPSTGSGTPTGDVSLLTSTGFSVDGFTLSGGQISGTTNLLPGGSYTVTAHYAGDTIFGGSNSAPVAVVVGKENSSTQLQLVTFDWQGHLITNNASTAVYGSPYLLRMNVLNSQGSACQPNPLGEAGCPSGALTLTDNGSQLDAGTYALNSLGYAEDRVIQLAGGSNSVKAQYAGDNSFNPSTGSVTYAITPAPTTLAQVSTCCFQVSAPLNANANIQAQSSGVAPTGTLTLFVNGNAVPGTSTISPNGSFGSPPTVSAFASFQGSSSPFTNPGNYTIKLAYSGDANYQAATSGTSTQYVQCPVPAVTIQPSLSSVNVGSTVALIATVVGCSKTIAPTGTITFFEPILGLAPLPGTVSYTTITDPGTGNLALQGMLTTKPGFTAGYFANYNGDINYPAGSTCCAALVTVNGNDFTLSAQPSSVTVQAGFSALYQLVVGLQSNTGSVSFGANACSGLPPEASCNFVPDPTSNTTIANLQISTTGPHSIPNARPSNYRSQLFWVGTTLPFAAILLIGYRRSGRGGLCQRLLLTIFILLGAGCGGGGVSGGGGGGGGGGGTPPAAPTNLTATSASYSEIDLNWAQATTAGFKVYRSTTSGFTPSASNQIASYGPGYTPSYQDPALSPSTTYYYEVKATNSSGVSGPSNQASATTQGLDPGTLAGTYNITVTATNGSISHSVNLTLVVH